MDSELSSGQIELAKTIMQMMGISEEEMSYDQFWGIMESKGLSSRNTTRMIAGSEIKAGESVYIRAADGKVYGGGEIK